MEIFAPQSASWMGRLHPALRLAAALVFAVAASFLERPAALAAALALGLMALSCSGGRWPDEIRRLAALNGMFVLLGVTLALAQPGEAWLVWGPLTVSREGVRSGLVILARANAILWMVGALLRGLEPAELGYALDRLRAPATLTHLLLFMVRYVETLHGEYHRIRDAMDLRGFRPASNLHTLRSFGNLFGLLLVRSLERSERILAAMKCRGFHGRYYLLRAAPWHSLDTGVAALCAAGVLLIAGLEWFL